MAEDNRLTVNFELLGVREVTRIMSWSIDSGYLVSTDGFEFDILPGNRPDLRDLELQPVELLLGNASQLKGRIDRTGIGMSGSMVSCSGRDYMADLVECNVDPAFQVRESMTLADAITLVAQPCGIDTAISDGDALLENIRTGRSTRKSKARKRIKDPLQNVQPRQGGEGIYEYVNRLAARHGLTLQPGSDRNVIVLSAPDYTQDVMATIRVSASSQEGSRNNVVSAEAVRDYSRMATFCLSNGKQAGRSEDGAKANRKTYDLLVAAATYNSEMRRILTSAKIAGGRIIPGKGKIPDPKNLYRLLRVEDHEARTDDELDASTLRAVAERLKDTLSYRVKMRGHADPESGALWAINTMVHVTDEIRGIDEPLWVATRKFAFSPDAGATTELECWRPNSFQIELPSS